MLHKIEHVQLLQLVASTVECRLVARMRIVWTPVDKFSAGDSSLIFIDHVVARDNVFSDFFCKIAVIVAVRF